MYNKYYSQFQVYEFNLKILPYFNNIRKDLEKKYPSINLIPVHILLGYFSNYDRNWYIQNIGTSECYLDMSKTKIGSSTIKLEFTSSFDYPHIMVEKLINLFRPYDEDMLSSFSYYAEDFEKIGILIYRGSNLLNAETMSYDTIEEEVIQNYSDFDELNLEIIDDNFKHTFKNKATEFTFDTFNRWKDEHL